MPTDGNKDYIFEVHLHYLKDLHKENKNYPVASEKKVVRAVELSPYQRELLRRKRQGRSKSYF